MVLMKKVSISIYMPIEFKLYREKKIQNTITISLKTEESYKVVVIIKTEKHHLPTNDA